MFRRLVFVVAFVLRKDKLAAQSNRASINVQPNVFVTTCCFSVFHLHRHARTGGSTGGGLPCICRLRTKR